MLITKNDLLSKREQVESRMKQAEADLYFLQGQLALLTQLIEQEEGQDESANVGGIPGYGDADIAGPE